MVYKQVILHCGLTLVIGWRYLLYKWVEIKFIQSYFILFYSTFYVDLIHIHKGYFIAIEQSYNFPSASEVTLKNMDKYIIWPKK